MGRHRQIEWRRGPAVFVWAVLAFAGLQLTLSFGLEYGGPGECDPYFREKLERLQDRLAETANPTLVLMLGSSRARTGFCARRLCGFGKDPGLVAFNFGISGVGPMLETVHLRRLLAAGVRPDLLFIEIFPAAMVDDDGRPFEYKWLHGRRLQRDDFPVLHVEASKWAKLLWQWGTSRALPCTGYRGELRYLLGLGGFGNRFYHGFPWAGGDAYCWQPDLLTATAEQRARYLGLARSQYSGPLAGSRLARRSTQAVAELLGLCRDQGIAVALVLMPESSEFRTWYSAALRAGVDAYVAHLRRTWGVPVIDAGRWLPDADFWDGHHVLPAGAAAFTDRLGREGLGPLLRVLRAHRKTAQSG
jgi:hypothetical protein